MKRIALALASNLTLSWLLPPAANAQDSRLWFWRNLTPAEGPAPEPRSDGAAIHDPVGRRIVVFGGQADTGLLNDVWAFDLLTSSWTRLETSGEAPESRLGANAIYDASGHQMVIWAGQQGSRFYNDTWALDLRSLEWRDLSPPANERPQARYGAGAIYDPVERALVQFAGFTDISLRFNDTQVFDLDTNGWQEVGPRRDADRPEVRCLLTAAFDAPSRRMIIHGGQRTGPLGDTWAFDLGTRQWQNLTPEARPAGRRLAVSFIDRDGLFIVFGGTIDSGRVNETWAFHLLAGAWSRLEVANPPPAREAAMGAYVEEEHRFVVFGGVGDGRMNDVWELRPAPVPLTPQN